MNYDGRDWGKIWSEQPKVRWVKNWLRRVAKIDEKAAGLNAAMDVAYGMTRSDITEIRLEAGVVKARVDLLEQRFVGSPTTALPSKLLLA